MKNTTTILKIGRGILQKDVVSVISFCIVIILFTFLDVFNNNDPEIVFFNVGQGDAILIQQDNFQILVDGGPDDNIVYELAKQMPWYDKNIEIVVLTHPHEDHIRGVLNVLEEYTVEKVLLNEIDYENKGYDYLLTNYGDIIFNVVEGDMLEYGDITGEVLYPFKDELEQEENINNESVILFFKIKDYGILLMGDAEVEIEERLIDRQDLENIYILKAGHHCSKTASSDMFLTAINPDIAICSCGERNKFGHPHYETLEKFKKLNVQYLITYEEDNIVMKFDDL